MKRYGLLALALMVMCAQIAAADVLYDNFSLGPDSRSLDKATTTIWYGEQFSTSANSYAVSSVTLLMNQIQPGNALVSIYDDFEGKPKNNIGNLLSLGTIELVRTPTIFGGNGILLNPNSSYWVVLSAESGIYDWAIADKLVYSMSEPYAKYTQELGWARSEGNPCIMKVEASPVPEPTSLILLGSGIGVLGLAAWRKRK